VRPSWKRRRVVGPRAKPAMRGLRDKMRYQMEFNAKQGWFLRRHMLKAKGGKRIGQEAVEGGKKEILPCSERA
jgi:hypothetical protein